MAIGMNECTTNMPLEMAFFCRVLGTWPFSVEFFYQKATHTHAMKPLLAS
jgi:hypothetical protein